MWGYGGTVVSVCWAVMQRSCREFSAIILVLGVQICVLRLVSFETQDRLHINYEHWKRFQRSFSQIITKLEDKGKEEAGCFLTSMLCRIASSIASGGFYFQACINVSERSVLSWFSVSSFLCFLCYFGIVPLRVTSCSSLPPVCFSLPVFFRSFPHLPSSLLAPPVPAPLVSVSEYVSSSVFPRDATLPAFSTGTFPSVSVWYVSDYLYSACVCTLLLPFRLLLCLFVHCNSFLFFHCCFPRKPTHFPGACFEHRSTALSFPTLRVMWKMAAVWVRSMSLSFCGRRAVHRPCNTNAYHCYCNCR